MIKGRATGRIGLVQTPGSRGFKGHLIIIVSYLFHRGKNEFIPQRKHSCFFHMSREDRKHEGEET